jgi:sugar/nucleoside kinase (ribokinase family)
MKHDITVLGHVCKDVNIDHLGSTELLRGGAVIHSSASACAMGGNVLAITKVASEDKETSLKAFVNPANNIICLPSEKTTSIQNTYLTADKEQRNCVCIAQADPFLASDVPNNLDCGIFHLAGLIYGDYESGLIENLAKRGKVAVDVQGFLRHANKQTGEMFFEDWKEKKELLPLVHFLKTDAAEAKILTGLDDRFAAARTLKKWGAKEVMITHNTEVILYNGEVTVVYPLRPRNLSGRTGRGDTTFAAYLAMRLNNDIEASLLYAAACVSLKMETSGPFRGTKADVERYIRLFYNDFRE